MKVMSVTEPTSHPEMSWLNANVYENMPNMLVTEPTFHPEMSSLNVSTSANRADMSVTSFVHQLPMGIPHV